MTPEEIINKISVNGIRDMTDERIKQAIEQVEEEIREEKDKLMRDIRIVRHVEKTNKGLRLIESRKKLIEVLEDKLMTLNNKKKAMTALEILNKVETNGELLTTEIAIKAMDEYAEQEVIKFDEWKRISGWIICHDGVGEYMKWVPKNYEPVSLNDHTQPMGSWIVLSVKELYQIYKKENP